MTDKRTIPANTPTELIDFSGAASLPRHIEFTQRQTYGAVTIGRFIHRPDSNVVIGTTQYLVLIQEGEPLHMEWCVPYGEGLEAKIMEQGDIRILPPDTLVYERWRGRSLMLFMAIDDSLVKQILREVFGRDTITLKTRLGVRDPMIEGMVEAWREELAEHGAGGRVYAEALAITLIVHLFRHYTDAVSKPDTATGGMNEVRLKRVVEYIETNLSDEISLCTLASVAGLSLDHFNSVFKAKTCTTPHHFLIERRVHRAKELLLGSNMPLSEIAAAVGFANQSHFTLNFRKITGKTPLRFRLAGRVE